MAEERVREVRGPGGNRGRGPRPKLKDPKKIIRRLMGEILKNYTPHCILVLAGIFASAFASVEASLFLKKLIDNYITPLLTQKAPDYAPLLGALGKIAVIYAVGVVCTWGYNRIMVNVSQGTLRALRIRLFDHMERLPIRYFDTHSHGDIMSVYTNDVDTLRQMISQALPQLVSSAVSIAAVFVSMCILNLPLTALTVAMVIVIVFTAKKLSGLSGKYFVKQQQDLGAVNGYIEEMMDGQKVVKVFTHEDKSLTQFRRLNDQLRESADTANKYANIMMPVNAQLGNFSYALCAVVGALMAAQRRGRRHRGHAGIVSGTEQKLHHAHQPDFHAAEQHHHGTGGRGADFRAAGRGA
jgi:ATP-binding cassette subfamily B multidrug efflux pump